MKNFIFCAVGVTALRNVNILRHEGQRRDQEPWKLLRWRALLLAINCCCKALHLRCLHGYWLRPQRLIRHQCRKSKNYGSSPFSRQIAEFLKAIMNFWLLLQTTPMAASVLIKMAWMKLGYCLFYNRRILRENLREMGQCKVLAWTFYTTVVESSHHLHNKICQILYKFLWDIIRTLPNI